MKKLIAGLFLASLFTFVGCGEKTTGEKLDDAANDSGEKAEQLEKDAGKALDNLKK